MQIHGSAQKVLQQNTFYSESDKSAHCRTEIQFKKIESVRFSMKLTEHLKQIQNQ